MLGSQILLNLTDIKQKQGHELWVFVLFFSLFFNVASKVSIEHDF